MMRWYGSKNGLHISKKSRFLMVGITMSSSSFRSGVASAMARAEREREREREREMSSLKVYADRVSQPSRAIIIFCKTNKIDFEEVRVDLFKGQHKTPDFKEINPMGQVPAIDHGSFKLFESHAILSYLACAFPEVPDHWYPADLRKRANINTILDWHHTNLRRGSATLVLINVLAPTLGLPPNPEGAKEAEGVLSASLSVLESFWLKDNAEFLLGSSQPSIADLSLACEITQLEFLKDEDRERILGPHVKILQWIENVKNATAPHFEEVHEIMQKAKAMLTGKPASA